MASPKITVAVPLYNEVRFIEKTLKSFVDDADEIIIGDNASTDGSSEICRDYASRYKNIKYTRHEKNIGMARNGLFCMQQATGQYLCVTGAHDRFSPGSLPRMLSIIESDPGIAMVYPKHIIHMGEDASVQETYTITEYKDELLSLSPYQRVTSIIQKVFHYHIAHGLYRREVLSDPFNYSVFEGVETDVKLLAMTARRGKMVADENSRFLALFQNDRPKNFIAGSRRIMHAVTAGKYTEPYIWPFTCMCEVYAVALDMQKQPGAPSDFAKSILDILVKKFGIPEGFKISREGFPPVLPGREAVSDTVFAAVMKEFTVLERNKTAYLEKIRALKKQMQ